MSKRAKKRVYTDYAEYQQPLVAAICEHLREAGPKTRDQINQHFREKYLVTSVDPSLYRAVDDGVIHPINMENPVPKEERGITTGARCRGFEFNRMPVTKERAKLVKRLVAARKLLVENGFKVQLLR